MSDLISRAAAIEALEHDRDTMPYEYSASDAIITIKALPSAQQWIPCSERLPDTSHNLEGFLVTKKCGDENDVFTAVYYDGAFGWWDGEHFTEDNSIIAWKPLPIPFNDPT